MKDMIIIQILIFVNKNFKKKIKVDKFHLSMIHKNSKKIILIILLILY